MPEDGSRVKLLIKFLKFCQHCCVDGRSEVQIYLGTYNVPRRTGKINNVEYFDAGYFGISPRQADVMDPRHRIMFETAFEAIVDSGYNPKEVRGSNTGNNICI